MRKKAKRWFAIAVALAAIGFAGLNVLAYRHARAMMHFTTGGRRTCKPEELTVWHKARVLAAGVNVPRPTGQRTPSELAADCRVLTIGARDGITLETWYCARGETTPLVILFHGYSTEKTSLLEEAGAFLDLGVSVLLVDFRGSGGSSESYTTVGAHEADDVAVAVRFARQELSHSHVVLFGQSMGAASVLRAVSQHGVQPDAVIVEAVFDKMLNTVRNRFHAMRIPPFPSAELLVFWGGRQWGFDGFRHNPVDYAASIRCPVLFMHGEHDPRATLSEGRRVFDAVPDRKDFVTFPRCRHESYVSTHPDQWRAAVERILMELSRVGATSHSRSPLLSPLYMHSGVEFATDGGLAS